MKDDMNDEMFNGIPKIFIPSNGVLNWDNVLKSSDMAKRYYATHFKSWIRIFITLGSI
jgi:hypothetical protein